MELVLGERGTSSYLREARLLLLDKPCIEEPAAAGEPPRGDEPIE